MGIKSVVRNHTIMELSFSNHTFKYLGKEVFALSKKIKQMGRKPMMSFLQ